MTLFIHPSRTTYNMFRLVIDWRVSFLSNMNGYLCSGLRIAQEMAGVLTILMSCRLLLLFRQKDIALSFLHMAFRPRFSFCRRWMCCAWLNRVWFSSEVTVDRIFIFLTGLEKTIMQGIAVGTKTKVKIKMSERHHRYVWYDGNSK